MNRSIRLVTIFSFLLFLALIANLTYIQAFQTEHLAHNPRNQRQFLEAKSAERGLITAQDQVLAESVEDENGFYQRRYPFAPQQYGAVVGYLSDQFGSAGIESSQNAILSGQDNSLFTANFWNQLTGAKPSGGNVDLTLRPNVQKVAYEQLANAGYSGAVVAIKPSTGEILAMASTPSIDASTFVDPAVSAEAAQAAFGAYNSSPNAVLLNRATQQTQPPGSTFKVLTTIAALEAGDSADTRVTAASNITLPNTATTLENYGGTVCGNGGTTTLREAFRRSCNTAFAEVSVRHGSSRLRDVAKRFGIGDSHSELGLPVQESTVGPIPDDAALAQTSIGQRDAAFTPLDNAIVAATIANGGKRMEPHLISQITGKDLRTLKTIKPHEATQAISPQIASTLKDLMVEAEKYAGGDGSIASKTGTAEHGEDSRNSSPHAWYIAFSTSSDVAVSVLVENGGNRGQAATGGSVAAPIGREVIRAAMREQG